MRYFCECIPTVYWYHFIISALFHYICPIYEFVDSFYTSGTAYQLAQLIRILLDPENMALGANVSGSFFRIPPFLRKLLFSDERPFEITSIYAISPKFCCCAKEIKKTGSRDQAQAAIILNN